MELICFVPFLLPVPVLAVYIFFEWRKRDRVKEAVRVDSEAQVPKEREGER